MELAPDTPLSANVGEKLKFWSQFFVTQFKVKGADIHGSHEEQMSASKEPRAGNGRSSFRAGSGSHDTFTPPITNKSLHPGSGKGSDNPEGSGLRHNFISQPSRKMKLQAMLDQIVTKQLQEHGLDAVKKALRLIAEDEKYRQIGEQNKKRQIPAADHHKIKFNPETVGLISLWSSRSSSKGFDEWELRQATLRPMQTPAPLPEEEPSSDSATTPEGFVVKQVVVGKASAGPGANAAPSSESKNKKGRRVAFRKRLRIPLNRDLTDLDPLEWALLGPESQRSEEDIATAALSVGSDVRFHWGSKQPVVISRRPQVNNVRVRVKPAAKKPRASRVVDDSESEEDREWDPTSLVINDDDDDDDDDDHDDNDGNSESFGIHGDDEESVGSDENDGVANPALMSSDWDTLLQTSRAASGGATAMLDSLASVAVRTLAKLPPSLRSQLPQPWTSSDKQGAESQQSSRLGVLADVASSSASEDDDAPLPQRAAKRKPAAPAPISSHSIFSRSPRSAAPANGSASLSRPKKTKSLNVPKQSGKEKPMGKKRKSSEHAMKSPQVPGPRVRRKIASKKLNVSQ